MPKKNYMLPLVMRKIPLYRWSCRIDFIFDM